LTLEEPFSNVLPHPTMDQPIMKEEPINPKTPPGVTCFRAPEDDNLHDGHFTLPGGGGVADFSEVMAREDFHSYIQRHLTTYPKAELVENERSDFTRVFFPGLNTPVLYLEGTGQMSSPERLDHYARVIGLPFAQIANGSQIQHPPISARVKGRTVTIPSEKIDWIQAARERGGRESRFLVQLADIIDLTDDGKLGKWDISLALAALESVGKLGQPNVGMRQSMEALMLAQLRAEAPPHLELMTYSESSIVMGSVLSGLKETYITWELHSSPRLKRGSVAKHFDELVRERFTLATFGNGYRNLPEPFRVVHFYAVGRNPDRLTQFASSGHVRNLARRIFNFGSEKALTFEQPYRGFDAHNLGVGGASAIRLYLEKNAATSFKDLHALFRGKVWPRINRPTDAEIASHAKSCGSEAFLWNPREALG